MYGFKEIDASDLQQKLSAESANFKLIDVRTPAEVARGFIPGSENFPLHLIPVKADEICADDTIVFYCQSGARSAQACAFMSSRGLENVYNLRGGIMGWMQQGNPIAN